MQSHRERYKKVKRRKTRTEMRSFFALLQAKNLASLRPRPDRCGSNLPARCVTLPLVATGGRRSTRTTRIGNGSWALWRRSRNVKIGEPRLLPDVQSLPPGSGDGRREPFPSRRIQRTETPPLRPPTRPEPIPIAKSPSTSEYTWRRWDASCESKCNDVRTAPFFA